MAFLDKNEDMALTFDDVLLVPGKSDVLPGTRSWPPSSPRAST